MSPIRILVLCFAVEVIQFFCATEKKSAINKLKITIIYLDSAFIVSCNIIFTENCNYCTKYSNKLTCSLETGEGGIITSLGFDEVDSLRSLSLLFRTMPILEEDPENSVVPASDPL